MWVLIACLLDRAGISISAKGLICQQKAIIIGIYAPVDERIGHWNIVKKLYKRVEYAIVKIMK